MQVHKEWITPETWKLIDERKVVNNKICQTHSERIKEKKAKNKIYRIQQEGKDSNTYEQEGFYSKRSRKYSFKSENGTDIPSN